jgi:dihydrofolate reductase
MQTVVFSDSPDLPDTADIAVQPAASAATIETVRCRSGEPVYLCGGGAFAGSLLTIGLIEILRLKRAPITLGSGTRLFGETASQARLEHTGTPECANGYLFQEYHVLK